MLHSKSFFLSAPFLFMPRQHAKGPCGKSDQILLVSESFSLQGGEMYSFLRFQM